MQKAIKVRGLKRISVFRVFDFARKKTPFCKLHLACAFFFTSHTKMTTTLFPFAKEATRRWWRRRRCSCCSLLLLLLGVFQLVVVAEDREKKGVLLSNFQGLARCRYDQRVAFPRTEEELKRILLKRDVEVIRAVSSDAHSWNEKFWCARTTDEEEEEERNVNIFMNEVRVVEEEQSRARVFDKRGLKAKVTVDAGEKMRTMLEYVAEEGYALKSVPWFIDQTVGGALATCSHGSSLAFGSLSSQLVSLRTMLHNGTVETISERTHGRDVMDAFRCHVNQLGITLAATFEIFKQDEVHRMNRFVSEDHMLQEIEMISAAVRRCVDNGRMDWWHSCAMRRFAVRNMDDLSYYYYVPTRDAQRVKIRRVITAFSKRTRSDDDDDDDDANEDDFLFSSSSSPVRVLEEYYFKASSVDAASASAQSVLNPSSIRNRLMQNDDLVSVWTNLWQDALEPSLQSIVASNASAYLAMTEEQLDRNDNYPFDQAELAVPLANAGECLSGFLDSISEQRQKYWRSPILIRFLNAESALLSPAHARPSMYVNIENYKRSEEGKAAFRDAIRYLASKEKCDGRLHFGKFGWDEDETYSLYEKYGNAYCKFLCVKDRYDPTRRFETREMSRIFERDLDKCLPRACD
jgi:FAD/FMN-containing dehydrogenase